MLHEAVLSQQGEFTSFRYGEHNIRFKVSPKLEKYIEIKEWNHGYIVVMVKYKGQDVVEEYIDLVPILNNLYFDVDEFLAPIEKVRIG